VLVPPPELRADLQAETLERHRPICTKKDNFEPSTTTSNRAQSSRDCVARLVWLWEVHGPLIYSSVALLWSLRARLFAMPDIDPAALSRPNISTTPILPPKTISASAPIVPKALKISHVPPRIDLEPLYTALKSAIGEQWGVYKASISLFVMGMYLIYSPEKGTWLSLVEYLDDYQLIYVNHRPTEPDRIISTNRQFSDNSYW